MSPRTLLISECKDPLFHEITLTPTIPVRKNSLGNFLSVTFYLPEGLQLVNKEKCSVQLEGTKSVTVKVGASCTTLYGLEKLSVITPKITNSFGSEFWGVFGLPTIWVCVFEYFCEYFNSMRSQCRLSKISKVFTKKSKNSDPHRFLLSVAIGCQISISLSLEILFKDTRFFEYRVASIG